MDMSHGGALLGKSRWRIVTIIITVIAPPVYTSIEFIIQHSLMYPYPYWVLYIVIEKNPSYSTLKEEFQNQCKFISVTRLMMTTFILSSSPHSTPSWAVGALEVG